MPRGRKSNESELIQFAIAGINARIEELEQKREQLAAQAGGRESAAEAGAGEAGPGQKRRKVSAATRAKLKAAAKKRWAREKRESAQRERSQTAAKRGAKKGRSTAKKAGAKRGRPRAGKAQATAESTSTTTTG